MMTSNHWSFRPTEICGMSCKAIQDGEYHYIYGSKFHSIDEAPLVLFAKIMDAVNGE